MKGLYAVFKVFRALFSLNRKQLGMLLRQRLKGNFTPNEWLDFFSKLSVLERKNPLARFFLKRLMSIFLVIGLITFVLIFTLHLWTEIHIENTLIGLSYGMLCCVLLLNILLLVVENTQVKGYFSKFIFPLVVILREEAYPNALLGLEANLITGMHRRNFIGNKKNYKRKIY